MMHVPLTADLHSAAAHIDTWHGMPGSSGLPDVAATPMPPSGQHNTAALLGACWTLIAFVAGLALMLDRRRIGAVVRKPSTGPPPYTPRPLPGWGLARLCVLRT